MGISKETLQQQAVNFLEFQKGRALHSRNQAVLEESEQLAGQEIWIKASVRDLRTQYKTEITIGDDILLDSECSCGEYRTAQGLCRHRIAALLQFMSQAPQQVQISTSSAAQMILVQYEKKSLSAPAEYKNTRRKMRFVLSLVKKGNTFFWECKAGYETLYKIQDLIAFLRSYRNGEIFEFGKKNRIQIGEQVFDLKSVQIIRLVQMQIENYLHHNAQGGKHLSVYAEKISLLEVEEILADEYFSCLYPGKIMVKQEDSLQELEWKQEDPDVHVSLQKEGMDGAGITITEKWSVFYGNRHLYLCNDIAIYQCSTSFSDHLRPFFEGLLKKAYPSTGRAEISAADLPRFYRYVAPYLRQYVQLEEIGVNQEQYEAPSLELSFFLDSPKNGVLTLTCEARYGRFSFNPVLQTQVPSRILRETEKEQAVHDIVAGYFTYRDQRGTLFLEDEEKLYLFLDQGITALEQLGTVYVADAVKLRPIKKIPSFMIHVSFVENMLQLEIKGEQIPSGELRGLLDSFARKRNYHKLQNGDIIRLEAELSEVFQEMEVSGIVKALDENGSARLAMWKSIEVHNILKSQHVIQIQESKAFLTLIEEMRQIDGNTFTVPDAMNHIMHAYQRKGFQWMKILQKYHFGGILADDMGLGKTIQMIAILADAKKENRTSLVVCPASLIYNWQNEIQTFAPALASLVVSGTLTERVEKLKEWNHYDVLITSYELVRRDFAQYQEMSFFYEILDEAQYIKNHSTMNAKVVKEIKAEYRMALTGTPIENRLSELWSIFDYLMPGYLHEYPYFRLHYEQVEEQQREQANARLRSMIAPFILRRKKQEVKQDLPQKEERVIYSGLEGLQKELYQAAFEQLKEQLSKEEDIPQNRMKILAQLTRLRQICCDPSLCFEAYTGGSAKLETCLELMERAVDGEHHVLLFSQFTSMLSIISERLTLQGIHHIILTGNTSKEERIRLVEVFQKGEIPVFLISLKAGGTGLNLTAADVVIHYDPWWNMAAQNQATDRAHRIGQDRMVTVYRLIAKNTLEESILKLQEEKKQLSEDILSADFAGIMGMSPKEWKMFLTRGCSNESEHSKSEEKSDPLEG